MVGRITSAALMSFFGLGQQKPHHYREMVRIVWENRDQLPFAWRILTRGVCDGCALGTTGVRDWTLPGTHLCMVRLELLRLNTAPALDPGRRRRRVDAGRPVVGGSARAREAARADAAAARRARLPRRELGRGARRRRRRPARHRAGAARLLPHLARHHQRGLLRGAEGGALLRHQPRRQRGAAVPRGVDGGDEGDARLRRLDLQLRRLARRRPDRAVRLERRQQPAGHDQVPARSEGARRAGRRRQPVSRAGPDALLDPVDRQQRDRRHPHRRPLDRRAHRRRPRLPRRRAEGGRCLRRRRPRLRRRAHHRRRGGAGPRRRARRGTRSSARAA